MLGLALVLPAALLVLVVGVLFASVDVPRPDTIPNPQVSLITYSDGKEIGRIGAQNRVDVPLSQVSEAARRAVLAAENRDYYSEPGIRRRASCALPGRIWPAAV